MFSICESFSGRGFSIIIAGGYQGPGENGAAFTYVRVKSGNSKTKRFTNSPLVLPFCKMLNHNGSIYLFNGSDCRMFDQGIWKHHSVTKDYISTPVSTDIGIFLFPIPFSESSFQYLLNDQRTWKVGKNGITG